MGRRKLTQMLSCVRCGADVEVPRWKLAVLKKGPYCSRECDWADRAKWRVAEPPIARTCRVCGVRFQAAPYLVRRGGGVACSVSCSARMVKNPFGGMFYGSLKHGLSGTSTYRSWKSMMHRCYRPTQDSYPRYGGKGIVVCERWHAFENFYADMGNRPKGLTLDRINSCGNYEPANCRWATWHEQAANRIHSNQHIKRKAAIKEIEEYLR